jgi:hypothetical protein
MNYRFSEFYKRDINFVYEQELNNIDWLTLRSGSILKTDERLIYTVDKIDSYINEFDVLPSIGIPLVSKRWLDSFIHLEGNQLQFVPAVIKDDFKNQNTSFYALNVLKTISCLDKEKSIFQIDEDGDYEIKKFFISPEAMKNYTIVRMEEHRSYIIVTGEFKRRCEEAGLKGINFIEEGHSIYTDL